MLGESDQLFSRVVSKEANPSFRVYYGGASGAVPFVWESQPGTPKSTKRHCDTSLPPSLAPPPSYQNPNQFNPKRESPKAKSSRLKLLGRMFTRLVNIKGKKPRVSSSESSYSSSSSSSSSLWSPAQSHHRRRRPQSPLSSLDSSWSSFRGADEEEEMPVSSFCFGKKPFFSW